MPLAPELAQTSVVQAAFGQRDLDLTDRPDVRDLRRLLVGDRESDSESAGDSRSGLLSLRHGRPPSGARGHVGGGVSYPGLYHAGATRAAGDGEVLQADSRRVLVPITRCRGAGRKQSFGPLNGIFREP